MYKIVLMLLVVAVAADVSHLEDGYTYDRPASSHSVNKIGGINGLGGLGSLGSGSAQSLHVHREEHNTKLTGSGQSLFGHNDGVLTAGGLVAPSTSIIRPQFAGISKHKKVRKQTRIIKNFFLHSAPEDDDDEELREALEGGPSQQRFNVVFLKAPAQSSKASALSVARAVGQDKTVIYVLSKKTDSEDIRAALEASPAYKPQKPEVFFIKYKSPEEAAFAQQQIKAQYDNLGGIDNISDEGLSPVSSVIGALGSSDYETAGSSIGGISKGYLPPAY